MSMTYMGQDLLPYVPCKTPSVFYMDLSFLIKKHLAYSLYPL